MNPGYPEENIREGNEPGLILNGNTRQGDKAGLRLRDTIRQGNEYWFLLTEGK